MKKDISYDEIFKDKDDKESKEKYNKMTFFDKFKLKFKEIDEVDKNLEMIETILKKGQSLLYVNLIKDKEHPKIFGME